MFVSLPVIWGVFFTVGLDRDCMRTATIRLAAPGGGLHPADNGVADHPDIERVAIDQIAVLDDGTGVALCRLRGDVEELRAILSESAGISAFHASVTDETIHVFVHFEQTAAAAALLALRRSHELVVRTPIRWLSDGRLEISAVGDDATLQDSLDGLPEDLHVELVEIGEYAPETNHPESLLTDKQLEVLDAALGVGYYEEPRRGTQADVADAVGLAPATVGEHLRRIEGKVLRALRE
jgi:predicted DNA binding protein